MKLSVFVPLAFLAISLPAWADDQSGQNTSLMDKTLEVLHLKHGAKPTPPPNMHNHLELQLDITPAPIKLSTVREVNVQVSLYNRSKKFIDLNFPTTQRVEILVLDSTGKAVTTWSEDQSFTNDPATVTVNPGERLQYAETLPTREMSAGKPYIIQVSFPAYPDLKIEQRIVPGN